MKIFADEFISFLKRSLLCSWKRHKKSKWTEVYWAPAHSAGYQAKFCQICHKQLETNKQRTIANRSLRTKAILT